VKIECVGEDPRKRAWAQLKVGEVCWHGQRLVLKVQLSASVCGVDLVNNEMATPANHEVVRVVEAVVSIKAGS
jgi:hypothetical protein